LQGLSDGREKKFRERIIFHLTPIIKPIFHNREISDISLIISGEPRVL